MKQLLLLVFICTTEFFTQQIGTLAPEKEPMQFPPNAAGVDMIFSEGGFGLGGFYRRTLNQDFTFFTDLSFSETKDEKEVEYYDYYTGQTVVFGKKNRIFLLPVYAGLQYRLFSSDLTDNLRPYVNFALGPTMVVTTPYEKEFFSSFGDAHSRFTAGGYIGVGANFGLNKKSLVGVNLRYYFVQFFDKGVEGLAGKYRKNLNGFFITINFGSMY